MESPLEPVTRVLISLLQPLHKAPSLLFRKYMRALSVSCKEISLTFLIY